jgi:hypothetical protein
LQFRVGLHFSTICSARTGHLGGPVSQALRGRSVRGAFEIRVGFPRRYWKVTCDKKRMKKQDDEGIRTYGTVPAREEGLGPGSAGQSGDTQGLSDVEAGAESVEELLEEGQSFEAEAIGGVEDASDPDVAEVHTKQVPEDDVPSEYLERD